MAWYLPTRGPVFWEELRRRLRGGRGYAVLFAYGVVLVTLMLGAAQLRGVGDNPQDWPDFGRALWTVFLVGQMALVLLVSPGVTAGAISAEREGKTLEHLFLTPLSTLSFILGKFCGAIGQMLVMILSGLPIVAVVFQYGGVSPKEVLTGYAVILATGLLYAALGFLASCLFARTVFAIVWAYGFMLLAFIGLPLGFIILTLFFPMSGFSNSTLLYSTCPLLLFDGFALNVDDAKLWSALGTMLTLTGIILVGCTLLIRRLRGVGPFLYRRISLTVARQNSRPPAREQG
jgi:ABC-2 type transport system permease protein